MATISDSHGFRGDHGTDARAASIFWVMPEATLRVLLLEDSASDADLVRRQLGNTFPSVELQHVNFADVLTPAVRAFAADVVLSNRPLACNQSAVAYSTMRLSRPAAPFILLTNRVDEETFIGALRTGPDDLVLKGNLQRLGPAIQDAIEARKPLGKLSPRQIEVLHLVAEGRSTREIADKLGLSVKTVESHRGAMMKRLGLHDVAALVRYAIRMGLVRSDRSE